MTATVIRRLNAGMYALIKTFSVSKNDVDSIITEVKLEVKKTKSQHCLVIEDDDITQCFYIDTDLTLTISNQKPRGGIFLKQKT